MSANRYNGRKITLVAVETCSKGFFGVLFGHGKSPCFLRCRFSWVVSVDGAVLVFGDVDVGEFLECALWYGEL
jgi:hypothetical protein